MDLLVRTIRPPDRNRVGALETIPHWGYGPRAMLGILAMIVFASPLVILGASLGAAENGATDLTLGLTFGMIVSDILLVFMYASFVLQNPRIYGLRTLWLAGVILAPPLVLPLYWWLHVWRAPFVGEVEDIEAHPTWMETDIVTILLFGIGGELY